MKKLLASVLVLSLLSTTGVMCFANSKTEIDSNTKIVCDVQAEGVAAISEKQEDTKVEIIDGLESIKKESALTWMQKVAKAWGCLKTFVDRHCVAVSAVASAIVTMSVCYFWSDFTDYVKFFFNTKDANAGATTVTLSYPTSTTKKIRQATITLSGSNNPITLNRGQTEIEIDPNATYYLETVYGDDFGSGSPDVGYCSADGKAIIDRGIAAFANGKD